MAIANQKTRCHLKNNTTPPSPHPKNKKCIEKTHCFCILPPHMLCMFPVNSYRAALPEKKYNIYSFQTAHVLYVLYIGACCVIHTQIWVPWNVNLTFPAQVTISFLDTYLSNSILNNILVFPCTSLLPLNTLSLFHLRSVNSALLAPVTSPFETAFLTAVLTLSAQTKACSGKLSGR